MRKNRKQVKPLVRNMAPLVKWFEKLGFSREQLERSIRIREQYSASSTFSGSAWLGAERAMASGGQKQRFV